MTIVSILLPFLALLAGRQEPAPHHALRPGQRFSGFVAADADRALTPAISPGMPAQTLLVRVSEAGPAWVEFHSDFFLPYFILRQPDGSVSREGAGDLGVFPIRFALGGLEPGATYRLQVTCRNGEYGAFEILLSPGLPPSADREDLADRLTGFVAESEARVVGRNGEGSPAHIRRLHALGSQAFGLGLIGLGGRLVREALRQAEAGLPADSPLRLRARDYVGSQLLREGRLQEARVQLERVLRDREAAGGAAAELIPVTLGNLGLIAQELGRLTEAEPLLLRALSLRKKWRFLVDEAYNHLLLGWLYSAMQRFEEARGQFEAALAIRREILGPGDPGVAEALGAIAEVLRIQGRVEEALPRFDEAIRMADAWPDGGRRLAVPFLENKALALQSLGAGEAALRTAEEALARAAEAPSASAQRVRLLALLARLRQSMGQMARAEEALRRAEAVLAALPFPDPALRAQTLHSMGEFLYWQGRFAEASGRLEEALALRATLYSKTDPRVTYTQALLGVALREQGFFDRARSLQEQTLAAERQAYGPEHPYVAFAEDALGITLRELGLNHEALPHLQRSLALRRRLYTRPHPELVTSLNNLAIISMDAGHHSEARVLQEEALAIARQVYPEVHVETAKTLHNLGFTMESLGQLDQARPLYEEALGIYRQIHGETHPDAITILNSLAQLDRLEGHFDSARRRLEDALAATRRQLGPRHLRAAVVLTTLGRLLLDEERPAEASGPLEQALAIRLEQLGATHPDTIATQYLIGLAHWQQGDLVQAADLLAEAARIWEAVLGAGHPRSARARLTLGLVLADQGRTGEAWREIRSAHESQRARLDKAVWSLTERERLQWLGFHRSGLDALISLAARETNDLSQQQAYESLLAWKGRASRALWRTRRQLLKDYTPEEQAWVGEIQETSARLSRRLYAREVADREAHAQEIERLRAHRNEVESRLQRALAPRRPEEGRLSVAALRAALPKGSALVDFFVHPVYQPAPGREAAGAPRGRWSEPVLSAWIVRPDEAGVMRSELGPAEDIRRSLERFKAALLAGRGGAPAGNEETGPGAELSARLWKPLVPALEGVDHVILSPDSFLGGLAFGTLPAGGGRFLVEDLAFSYMQDPRSILAQAPRHKGTVPSLLVAGGVDYDQRSESAGPARVGTGLARRGGWSDYWPPLPATRAEAEGVFHLHKRSCGEGGRRLLLEGSEATEERIKAEAGRYSALHLATHGFFQPEIVPSMWSAVLVTETKAPGSRRRLAGSLPGLLSGLVLAGANEPPREGADDGLLTAEEVGWLDLSEAGLVVLSACETGLGRSQSGEGLLGLRRAFHLAGAQTVVSSLWSVNDPATSALMQRFYRNLWGRGLGRLEALRRAQLATLARNRAEHRGRGLPATWGAFVLSGDWR